eukprot:CAMPEP_0117034318 /NCGR_PEP_ID=MMETSP0472-20121206/24445_1 /TAXON_ID=693140 ORGANISM="Tiarina fusus, Strain LIS" /NCGR_SAMPLE_ID=MMETSP0472 /ASSEMBLY_ACC=CAM_ASM_000603 /LENGTH=256 /DNA_ID=CAMNT_0004743461 /DNA_START=455 /DNA_END=1222 /DNA_ORIENTATION=+
MSFQDVGKQNSNRRTANAALQKSGPATAGSAGASWGSSGPSVGQISESLTQYQRNVGILEKISQQLVSTGSNSATRNELEQQYKVQLDVLRQLEQRVRSAILAQRQQATNEAKKQALRKLERDFERVQATAQSCKAKVTRQQKQLQQRGGNAANNNATDNAAANALQQEQERFQIQIQEDRLAEEIMREREEEIRNINKGMHQVNEIYKDLAHIVGNQQEEVDQIETQMEDARGNAESGLKQVQTANEKYDSQCTI